jgi:21S rRNA (uridine2791-2'-O)-methyltransferase
VAKDRTGPKGLVVGIDLIPAQPPRGVSTIQGNFLSPAVRNLVKTFVAEGAARKQSQQQSQDAAVDQTAAADTTATPDETAEGEAGKDAVVVVEQTSYIDAERLAARDAVVGGNEVDKDSLTGEEKSPKEERLVDVSSFAFFLVPSSFRTTTLTFKPRPHLSGGSKRYVSTLAPNAWLHHPQLE